MFKILMKCYQEPSGFLKCANIISWGSHTWFVQIIFLWSVSNLTTNHQPNYGLTYISICWLVNIPVWNGQYSIVPLYDNLHKSTISHLIEGHQPRLQGSAHGIGSRILPCGIQDHSLQRQVLWGWNLQACSALVPGKKNIGIRHENIGIQCSADDFSTFLWV